MNDQPQPEKVAAAAARLFPALSDPPRLIHILCSCVEFDDNDSTAAALAELDGAQQIKIMDLLRYLVREKDNGGHTASVAADHLLRALAQRAPSGESFFEALDIYRTMASQGLYLSAILEATEQYAACSPDAARDLLDRLIPNADDDVFFTALKATLSGVCKTNAPNGIEFIRNLSKQDSPRVQSACVGVLCSQDYSRYPSLFRDAKLCLEELHSTINPDIQGALTSNLPDLLKSIEDADLELMFIDLCRSTSPEMSPLVIHTLWRTIRECRNKAWHRKAMEIVLSRPILSDNDMGWLDYCFSDLLRNQDDEFLPHFEKWMLRQERRIDPEFLSHVLSQIFRIHDLVCRCITRWFNSECRNLNRFAEHMVGRYHDPLNFPNRAPLHLDKTELKEMAPLDVELTIRHIIGYCLMHEQPLFSLVFSASQKTNCRKAIDDIIVFYFIKHIFPNYGGDMRDFLKAVSGVRNRRIAQVILDATEDEWNAYLNLPTLSGNVISDEESRKLTAAEHRPIAEAFSDAMKNSLIGMIATTIPLKYGRAFITYEQLMSSTRLNAATQQNQSEPNTSPLTPSPLRRSQISWVIPAQVRFDPLGTEYQMSCLRNTIRTKQSQ